MWYEVERAPECDGVVPGKEKEPHSHVIQETGPPKPPEIVK